MRRQMFVKPSEAALRRAPLIAKASAMQGDPTYFSERALREISEEDGSEKIQASPASFNFQEASVLMKIVESGNSVMLGCGGNIVATLGNEVCACSHSLIALIARTNVS